MGARKIPKFDKNSFKPFVLEIDVNDEATARALYAIFNYSGNRKVLGYDPSEEIKDALGSEYYVNGDYEVIANGVTYEAFYRMKK